MKPTIVFLHGLNCSSKIFSFLQTQLPEHTPIFIDYKSSNRIDDSYKYVLNKLPKKQPFSIVGHSLGGVLAYLIAVRTKKPDNIISISSPFGGSKAAGLMRWLYPKFEIFKDLAPYSSMIREIEEYAPSCPFLSIVSTGGDLPFINGKNDGVVSYESQISVLPNKRIEVTSNHFEAVQDMDTVKAVRDFIF